MPAFRIATASLHIRMRIVATIEDGCEAVAPKKQGFAELVIVEARSAETSDALGIVHQQGEDQTLVMNRNSALIPVEEEVAGSDLSIGLAKV